jgi:hypothetical protein
MGHTKKQEDVTEKLATECVFEVVQMVDLAHKDFKVAIINIFKELKRIMLK